MYFVSVDIQVPDWLLHVLPAFKMDKDSASSVPRWFGWKHRTSNMRLVRVLLIICSLGLVFRQVFPLTSKSSASWRQSISKHTGSLQRPITSLKTAQDNAWASECGQHGWQPYKSGKNGKRRVYDLVIVNTELDWLEIRLNTLHEEVDYFVILESTRTFTGQPKTLALNDNWERFEKFRKQIIYHVFEEPPKSAMPDNWDNWGYERYQKNAMFTQVLPRLVDDRAPVKGDVLLMSDLDEVPKPESIALIRHCDFPRRLTLKSRFYYYSFQWAAHLQAWDHPHATTYDGPDNTILPEDLRYSLSDVAKDEKQTIDNASWHCSSCFSTIEEMLVKMASFSHSEYNLEQFRQKPGIVDKMRKGLDLWDRAGQTYDRVDDNMDVPQYVKDNAERFHYLLDRDGPDAGFEDYN